MVLRTIGTAAPTTLFGFVVGTNDLIPADVASLLNGINDDQKVATAPVSARFVNCYNQTGSLVIPNRGQLRLLTGDFVAWDSQTGFPIVVSALAAANAGWVHT